MEPTWMFVSCGSMFFCLVNYISQWAVPKEVNKTFQARWKFRNVLTSWTHSFITGVWSALSFYMDPAMCQDMIHSFNTSIHVLVSFSIGYFIYDFVDMFLFHKKRSTYELLLHHFMVILCYGVAVLSKTYVSYAALSLIVEINSVFLHARQLFIISGVPKTRVVFKITSLFNVITFVLFRILLLGWMTRWLTSHREQVPFTFFTIGSVGLATIFAMNIVLFYRILMADFVRNKNSNFTFTPDVKRKMTASGNSRGTSPTEPRGFPTVDSLVRSFLNDDNNT